MAMVRYEPWSLLARLFDDIKGKAVLAACLSMGVTAGVAQPAADMSDGGVTRYSATTANLDPEGVALRFDILRWSDEATAARVVAALQSDDVHAAIDEVPTVGYVWPEGSPVGYSVKYARRETVDSGERLTLVTSRTLGVYDFGGWNLHGENSGAELDYSVIELDLSDSGNGTGLASLATPVIIDADADTLSLDRSIDSTALFVDAHRLQDGYN